MSRPFNGRNQTRFLMTGRQVREAAAQPVHKCACGCSQETKRDFTPGHDQKVIP